MQPAGEFILCILEIGMLQAEGSCARRNPPKNGQKREEMGLLKMRHY